MQAKRPRDRKLWHKWFAWHQVEIGSVRVWLQYIDRRWYAVQDWYIGLDGTAVSIGDSHSPVTGRAIGEWQYRLRSGRQQ